MAPFTNYHHSFFSLFPICLFTFSLALSHGHHDHHNINGFSVELLHRDSPKSPFFNLSETPSQRLINAFIRSINRKNRLIFSANTLPRPSPTRVQSTLLPNHGEYLMDISIGTPPSRLLAIADTGSDLTWTQCKPCTHCYNQTAPLFDPSSSKTYVNIPCKTSTCRFITGGACVTNPSLCPYTVEYGDQSYTKGYLATDTLALASTGGRPVSFPSFVFGCGNDNDGTFDKGGSGIVGLGNGKASLVSQLNSSIGGKFSYCLVPIFTEGSSKMNFGSGAVVSGTGTVSTPLLPGTFYYLTMEGISVGDARLVFPDGSDGNTIIDSGTTLTILPSDFYSDLESAMINEINSQRVDDPSGFLSLCYKSPESEGDFHAPILTVHFSGADVKLTTLNTFIRVSADVVCFAFHGDSSSGGPTSIYGNLSQMNFLVGYDTQKMTVSFKPTDCSKT